MDELLNELAAATETLKAAERNASEARRVETNAINRLNNVQKAVDTKLAELRAKAPRGSDWASKPGMPAIGDQ